MSIPLVNHLFVTPRFLIKGQVATGELRLTSLLLSYRRPLLSVEDITLWELKSGSQIVAERGQIRVENIILAHEFLSMGGDEHRRKIAALDDAAHVPVSLYLGAPVSFEVFGKVRREVMDRWEENRFIVVQSSEVRGVTSTVKEVEMLANLSYAIVNTRFVDCLFRYE